MDRKDSDRSWKGRLQLLDDDDLEGSETELERAQEKSGEDLVSGSTTDVASITGVAFEPSLVLAGVSTPTSVRGTGHWGGDSDDEMWEESSKGSFSSESEDDLPAIDLSVKESISVSELVPNEVVWAQYDTYVHWPALVVSVTPKRMTKKRRGMSSTVRGGMSSRGMSSTPRKPPKARVIFFGYDGEPYTVTISTAENIARFGTKDTEMFMERGRAQVEPLMRKHFMMAVDEAKKLLRARADKEISGDPMEQMRKIAAARLKGYSPAVARKRLQSTAVEGPPTISSSGYQLDDVQGILQREPSNDKSSDSESEEESSPHASETVTESFQELEASGLHQDSHEGMISCLNCSKFTREKKLSLARSKQYCSLGCMQEWKTKHPPKEKSESNIHMACGSKRATRSHPQTTILSVSTHTPNDIQQLPVLVRNLYIDMAPPGSTLPHPVDSEEEPYSQVATSPTATTQSASSARNEKKGSHHKGTSKGEIEPPPKRRRTEALKQSQKTKKKVYRRKRCGKCTACCREDCGTCVQCRDKKKFGGKGILKKPCIHCVCKHLMYGKRGSNASESEQDDSVGNQADREISIDSQVKEAVESDETIGYSDCPSGSESEPDSMVVKIRYPIVHPLTVLNKKSKRQEKQLHEQEENTKLRQKVKHKHRQLKRLKALLNLEGNSWKKLDERARKLFKRRKNKTKGIRNRWGKILLLSSLQRHLFSS